MTSNTKYVVIINQTAQTDTDTFVQKESGGFGLQKTVANWNKNMTTGATFIFKIHTKEFANF